MKRKYVFIILFILMFSGCYTIEHTTRYYKNLTANPISPKPHTFIAPIISPDQTKRAYKVIGEMDFESGGSENFLIDAIQYNARINGADAIILQKWEKEKNSYVSWHPGYISYSYSYRYHCDIGVILNDYYIPPHYETNTYITNKIKALMIVFLDHETFGYLGFIFEDVRNTDYLEIGNILKNSPAEKSGLQKGDKIRRINNYSCDKGLNDYYENGSSYTAGKEYEIEYLRDGKAQTMKIKAEKVPTQNSKS